MCMRHMRTDCGHSSGILSFATCCTARLLEPAGLTTQGSSDLSRGQGVHDNRSPAADAVQRRSSPKDIIMKVSGDDRCTVDADRLRKKTERSSGILCMYTGIREPRKVSTPAVIDNRVKLAQFVNSMYSFEQVQAGKGARLDVTFVPYDCAAAAMRFPPLPFGHETVDGEEHALDGTTWTSASRNAAVVLLTQNEGLLKFMRHPRTVHEDTVTTVDWVGS